MKKRMLAAAVLVAALAVLCLAGCGSSASDENYREGLPAWADEAAEKLEQGLGGALDQFGAFEGFTDVKYGQSAPAGRSAVTVIQRADYENQKAQFNVSFYEDGSLAGLYVYKVEG